MRVEGVIRMARLRRESGNQVIGRHMQSRDHRTTVQTGAVVCPVRTGAERTATSHLSRPFLAENEPIGSTRRRAIQRQSYSCPLQLTASSDDGRAF